MAFDPQSRLAALELEPPYQAVLLCEHPHGVLWGARYEAGRPPPDAALRAHALDGAPRGDPSPQRLAGRCALREAIRALEGSDPGPIGQTARGAPALPPGLAGSVTHKDGLALALVAPASGAALGVDLEARAPDRSSIAPRVLREEELRSIAGLAAEERWLQIVARFSVKEAIYKAIDPFLLRYVRFAEVGLKLPTVLPRGGLVDASLEAHFDPGTPPLELEATCALAGRWILSTARARKPSSR